MSRPKLVKGTYIYLLIGNGLEPETFTPLCGARTKNFNHTIDTADDYTPDCADPIDVPSREVRAIGERWDIPFTAVLNRAQLEMLQELEGEPRSYRFAITEPDDDVVYSGYYTGQGLLTGLNIIVDNGINARVEGTIESDAGWVFIPSALAMSDFENDVHSIGGVAKTFADLWTLVRDIDVAADGLGITHVGAGLFDGQANATAALRNAVSPFFGYTAVFDVTAGFNPADAAHDLWVEVGANNPSFSSTAGFILEYGNGSNTDDAGTFAPPHNNFAFGPISAGDHRIAFTTAPGFQAYSIDGAEAVEGDPTTNDYLLFTVLYLYAATIGTPSGGSIRFRNVSFLPIVMDKEALEELAK